MKDQTVRELSSVVLGLIVSAGVGWTVLESSKRIDVSLDCGTVELTSKSLITTDCEGRMWKTSDPNISEVRVKDGNGVFLGLLSRGHGGSGKIEVR